VELVAYIDRVGGLYCPQCWEDGHGRELADGGKQYADNAAIWDESCDWCNAEIIKTATNQGV